MKKKILVCLTIIIVLFGVSVGCLSLIPNNFIYDFFHKEVIPDIPDEDIKDKPDQKEDDNKLTFADMVEAVEQNKNLTDDEKEFTKSYMKVIEDNIQYINLEELQKRLSTFKVIYEEPYDINIVGEYMSGDVEIHMYIGSNFDDFRVRRTFAHELNHLYFLGPYSMKEGMAETLRMEYQYFEEVNFTYLYNRINLYMLIELVGPELVMETHSSEDDTKMVEYFKTFTDDLDTYYGVLNYLVSIHSKDLPKKPTNQGISDELYEKVYGEYNRLINYFYKKIHGIDMMDNEVMANYVAMQHFNNHAAPKTEQDLLEMVNADERSKRAERYVTSFRVIPARYFNKDVEDMRMKVICQVEYFYKDGSSEFVDYYKFVE